MNDRAHVPEQVRLPKPDSVQTYDKMTTLDRAFHEHVLRHAKGIINLYEEWIKQRNR